MQINKRILYIVNVDWFFISHRLPLAIEAKKRGYEVFIAAKNTGRFNQLEEMGFFLYNLNIDRSGINPLYESLIIFNLIKIIKKIKPLIIHCITLKISLYSSISARFVYVPKIINAISGLGYNFSLNRKTGSQLFINIFMKLVFSNKGFYFIFQNPDDLLLFKKMKLDKGNNFCLIKGSGVDMKLTNFEEREIKNSLNFILTARMLKDKGIIEFIDAAKIVLAKYSDAGFILVGDIDKDNPASFTKEELQNKLNGTKVVWLGYRSDILELLQSSNIMVLPSYREGLPKSLIEAMAMGMPIITTDTPGCRECVKEGINGFLVPKGNSKILAEKMIELIENPLRVIEMGRASRLIAEREFSLEQVIEKTFKIYENSIS